MGLRHIEGFPEVLAGFDFGTTGCGSLLALPLLTLLVRFIRGIIGEREVGIAADRVGVGCLQHRQPGPCLVQKVLYLLRRHLPCCRVGSIHTENDCASLIGRGTFLQIRYNALQLRFGVSAERILLPLYIVDGCHRLLILGLLPDHLVNDIDRMLRPALLLPGVALDGL